MKLLKRILDYERHEKLITKIYAWLTALLLAACIFVPNLWGGN